MASTGYQAIGASIRQINGNARGSVHAPSVTEILQSLTAYIRDAVAGDSFVAVIYNATSLNAASLLATSVVRTDISTPGWYTFTFSSSPMISAGVDYWIGVGSNSAADAEINHDTGVGYSISGFNPIAPPATWDLGANVDARLYSTYVTTAGQQGATAVLIASSLLNKCIGRG